MCIASSNHIRGWLYMSHRTIRLICCRYQQLQNSGRRWHDSLPTSVNTQTALEPSMANLIIMAIRVGLSPNSGSTFDHTPQFTIIIVMVWKGLIRLNPNIIFILGVTRHTWMPYKLITLNYFALKCGKKKIFSRSRWRIVNIKNKD